MIETTFCRKKRTQQSLHHLYRSTTGFTMVEVLVVVIMVGVLAVISGAGYLNWMKRLEVNAARDAISNAIHDAQTRAREQNSTWQVSFQDNKDGRVGWAVHPVNVNPKWILIEQSSIQVDSTNTSLLKDGDAWIIQFDNKGNVIKPTKTGIITLSSITGLNKRCVEVKTILGAIRLNQDKDCKK